MLKLCSLQYVPKIMPLWTPPCFGAPFPWHFLENPALVLGTLDYVFSSRLKNAKFCGKLKHS